MFKIENVIREYNGVKNEVKFLAGLGRLTTDVEAKKVTTKKGKQITVAGGYNQSIAFNYWENGERKPMFFPIEAWDKIAENLGKLGKKGVELFVTGRLEKRTYISKQGKQYINEYLIIEQFKITSGEWEKIKNSESKEKTEKTVTEETVMEIMDEVGEEIEEIEEEVEEEIEEIEEEVEEEIEDLLLSEDDEEIPF